jgi:hypothetical protein
MSGILRDGRRRRLTSNEQARQQHRYPDPAAGVAWNSKEEPHALLPEIACRLEHFNCSNFIQMSAQL